MSAATTETAKNEAPSTPGRGGGETKESPQHHHHHHHRSGECLAVSYPQSHVPTTASCAKYFLTWDSCMFHFPPAHTVYRRAILQALEWSSLHDFNSRSNIDSIRRHTKEILAEHENPDHWNDALFLQTLKAIANNGDVEICANILAELSPTYKRKRADSLQKKLEQQSGGATARMAPVLPIIAPMPIASPHHSIIAFKDPKIAPHRPREHEKWKIISKKEYDHST